MNDRDELSCKLLEYEFIVSALTDQARKNHFKKPTNKEKELTGALQDGVNDKKAEIKAHVDYMLEQEYERGHQEGYNEGHSDGAQEQRAFEYRSNQPPIDRSIYD